MMHTIKSPRVDRKTTHALHSFIARKRMTGANFDVSKLLVFTGLGFTEMSDVPD